MKNKHFFIVVLVLSLFLVSTQVNADLISTFDSNNEGWIGEDPTGDWTASWQSTGGNPGGYFKGVETNPQGNVGFYKSPDSWDGNWNAYKGGTLKFDINIISGTTGNYFSYDDVRIYSGSDYMYMQTANSAWANFNNWNTFEVPITGATFAYSGSSSFDDIMANVTALWIRGEYINYGEAEGLDNVYVTAARSVPEPATFLLLGLGLTSLIGLRRKIRK
jgi:hypothetical protein